MPVKVPRLLLETRSPVKNPGSAGKGGESPVQVFIRTPLFPASHFRNEERVCACARKLGRD